MDDSEIIKEQNENMKKEVHESVSLVCLQTLLKVLEKSKATTVGQIDYDLKNAIGVLANSGTGGALYSRHIAIDSCTKLFQQFITLAQLDDVQNDFCECKKVMLARGHSFLRNSISSSQKIAEHACDFILDGSLILTPACPSLAFIKTIEKALQMKKNFRVAVLSSSSSNGKKLVDRLRKLGTNAVCMSEGQASSAIDSVTFVMIGAEAVMENGGVYSSNGSAVAAILAAVHKKPLYVLAESFKFYDYFPISKQDVPSNIDAASPNFDYTEPHLIRYIFSDLGVLTPFDVSYESQNLYI